MPPQGGITALRGYVDSEENAETSAAGTAHPCESGYFDHSERWNTAATLYNLGEALDAQELYQEAADAYLGVTNYYPPEFECITSETSISSPQHHVSKEPTRSYHRTRHAHQPSPPINAPQVPRVV